MSRLHFRLVAVAVGSLCLLAPLESAQAALVTWSFEGTVRDILNPERLPGAVGSLGIEVGAQVTGQVQMEMDTPPSNHIPGAAQNSYAGAVRNTEVTIGDWSIVQTDPGSVLVIGELDLGPGEFVNAPMTDPGTGVAASFSLQLSQNSYLWSSTAMLATPPPLDEMSPYGLHSFPSTYFIDGTKVEVSAGGAGIEVEMSSLVPEPQASALMVLASLLLPAARALRRAVLSSGRAVE
jgi:hypothetical protein